MAQARDLLRRIRSVKNTQQITRAMKMVAASKLRKVLDDTLALRPYAEGITKLKDHLVECNPDLARELYGEQREQKRVGVLFFTGDKGLCGSFNANLNKEMLNFINADEGMDFKISCYGRKGADYLRKLQKGRLGERIELLDTRHDLINNIKFPVALDYSRKAMKMHEEKQIDAYYIVFSTFANVLSQHPHVKKIWPADPQDIAEDSDEQFQHDYMYEPPAKELLSPILERFLSMSVFQAMLESASSEFAARMTAMENATRNADELIDDLTLAYNKARQAAITDEMLDIVGGAEAMRSSQ